MKACEHLTFAAEVDVGRLTNEAGEVTSYMADVRIRCADCRRPFQFLGLKTGIDTGGAMVSIDGLEARIALCPQGEEPSMLDRVAAHFGAPEGRTQ